MRRVCVSDSFVDWIAAKQLLRDMPCHKITTGPLSYQPGSLFVQHSFFCLKEVVLLVTHDLLVNVLSSTARGVLENLVMDVGPLYMLRSCRVSFPGDATSGSLSSRSSLGLRGVVFFVGIEMFLLL